MNQTTKNTEATKILALAITILMLICTIFTIFPATPVYAAAAGLGTYKVTTSAGLYVRSGAGTNYAVVGGIGYGAMFTVTQINGTWGYVPSYGGWSCLDYAQLIQSSSNTATSANIADGVYSIYFSNTNYLVDIEGANPNNGAKTILYASNGGTNQQYKLTRQSDGSYRITPMHSQNKCVEVRNSSKNNGAEVGIWDYVGIDCQKWYIMQKNGYYVFVNKNSGKYLDVDNGQAKNLTRVHQWGGDGGWTEQFRLVAVQSSSQNNQRGASWAVAQIGKSIDYDGVYGVQCVDLIKAYYEYLGVKAVVGNGCDYITNTLPTGWQRIKNTPEFIPQPGDIAVWTSAVGGGYGHVAIIITAGLYEFVSVDQNWGSSEAHKVTHNYSGFWGVIRPKF